MGCGASAMENMELNTWGHKMIDRYDGIFQELEQIDAENGLPEKLFLAISMVMPIPNIDLLIQNQEGKILLSWRDDEYFGKGWHIPGGCIRFKETMLERVMETARIELHTEVEINPEPLAIRDVIVGKNEPMPKVRAHHLAVLFECKLPEGYQIDNQGLSEGDAGYLKWFEKIPDNILKVHDCYKDIFERKTIL